MPINTTLFDSEGFTWDFEGEPGFQILNGQSDTFDGAMQIFINGVIVSPNEATLTGRELTAQAVSIGGVAVQRSILVSDTGISAVGFVRFFDSFTNTTNQTLTFTVSTEINSGADANVILPATSDGVAGLSVNDVGFTTSDDLIGGDTRATVAYGTEGFAGAFPGAVTEVVDEFTITRTLTLGAGETVSLLQFVSQSATEAEAAADLIDFTRDASGLRAANLLAGLTAEEQARILNYAGFQTALPAQTLVDADGNRWSVDARGVLSTLDTTALTGFRIPGLSATEAQTLRFGTDAATGDVTVVTGGAEDAPGAVVSYTYHALAGQAAIRLLVTVTAGPEAIFPGTLLDPLLTTGANPVLLPGQTVSTQFRGVVLDDSVSGSDGTLPALTFAYGAAGPNSSSAIAGDTFTVAFPDLGIAAGETATFLYFFALNDSGLAGLADLNRLSVPDPELLAGLSARQVAALRNFQVPEFEGRLQEVIGADLVDDVIIANDWGDSIVGGSGDDDIQALGSDDVVRGGIGDDRIDGGTGSDSVFGGTNNDNINGGAGDDSLFGEADEDFLDGQSGDDRLAGGDGTDTLNGGAGNDSLSGNLGGDLLRGDTGNDLLFGEDGLDDLYGGSGDDSLYGGLGVDLLDGGTGDDTLSGEGGADRLLGDSGADFLFGGEDGDTLFGGAGHDDLSGDDGRDLLAGGDNDDRLLGGANDDDLAGDAGRDSLFGGDGNDTLDGGTGDDTMEGGAGNDVFTVNSAGDVVSDAGTDFGFDEVRSAVSYGIGGTTIEAVTLTGTDNINATGNLLSNLLTGNAGNNVLLGDLGTDTLFGGSGADTLNGGGGTDSMEGGDGGDLFLVDSTADIVRELATDTGTDTVESSATYSIEGRFVENLTLTGSTNIDGTGSSGANRITGNAGNNQLFGGLDNDTITGGGGNDTLRGGDGFDVLSGNDNDDFIFGGSTEADLRDNLFGGAGRDNLDGGYGSDELRGEAGNDTLTGGFGADTLIGGTEADVLSGGALGDLMFGGDGADFINGGFGFDRANGGAGADTFFHLGIADHGTDFVQDYSGAAGDVLQVGIAGAVASQFQVNFANAGGGQPGVLEAFVIYRPTGQVLWALIDGGGQGDILLGIGGQTFDLV